MSAPKSLAQRLYYYAEHAPERVALASPNACVSYAQLATLVTRQVAVLATLGVSQSSVLGITCADDLGHLVLCLAAVDLGASSCTLASHESDEARATLGLRCHVTHTVTADVVVALDGQDVCTQQARALHHVADSAGLIFSTSGTTGEPKLVVHLDSDLVAQAHRHVGSHQERFACLASMEHNFAKRHRLYAVAAGAANVFIDAESDSLVDQCLALAVNVLHLSAFQAQHLLAQPDCHALADVRLKLGGGHVPTTLRQQLTQRVTPTLQAGYGTTETGAIAFTNPKDSNAGESVGQPLPGISVRIVGPQRKRLPVGERGEVAISGAGMFREYLGQSALTAEKLQHGWFYTGDIGYLDSQQRIHLCGRSDDMFVFNSMNIYPQDIESVILQHPDIQDAAVIPKASAVHGHIPVALLVFKPGIKQRLPALKKYVRKQAGVRSPRQYIIVPQIPKTPAGKIARSQARIVPNQSRGIRRDILGMLSSQATEHLRPSLVNAFASGDQDIKLSQLAMDSLARMEFLVALELGFNKVITPQELGEFRYLGNVVARVLAADAPPVSASNDDESLAERPVLSDAVGVSDRAPHIVRLFQRAFRYCHTVAQLHKVMALLEDRVTPLELADLSHCHLNNQLLPAEAATKYWMAVSGWLQGLQNAMRGTRNTEPEPFTFRRVGAQARLFTDGGSVAGKTLLVCFPPRGLRQLGIPNTVLLQYVDAQRFDVLLISSTFATGFHRGRSKFGHQLSDFSQWLATRFDTQRYRAVRTFGFSAGARAAIAAGRLLDAEVSVTVSGRFHRKRHVLMNLDQALTLWNLSKNDAPGCVLLSYVSNNARDRFYANLVAKLTHGRKLALVHQQARLKHLVLAQLLEQGELANYLNRTLLVDSVESVELAADEPITMLYLSG